MHRVAMSTANNEPGIGDDLCSTVLMDTEGKLLGRLFVSNGAIFLKDKQF